MHIVIPVRAGRTNRTLTATLNSIRTHTDLEPVIIGHNPGHYVTHIETVQNRGKFGNQELAMHIALTTRWISDPFIWSNDDILWTRPATPIRWALGELRDDTRTNVYGKRKHRTADILDTLGLPTRDYESHTPLPVTKEEMREALTLCEEGGTMRSLYGNLTGQPDRIAPDVKLRHPDDTLPDTEWISVANAHLIPAELR